MDQIIVELVPYLKEKNLFLIDGDLGSGKTTLISALMEQLNYHLSSSPTYALRQTYNTPTLKVEHVDLYRLASEDEVESIGLWDIFQNPQALVLVEWASRVNDADWPMDWKKYFLKISSTKQGRKYEFYEA